MSRTFKYHVVDHILQRLAMIDRRSSVDSEALTDGGVTDGTSGWRVAIVAAVLLMAVVLIHATPVEGYLTDVDQLRDRLLALGPWVYPLAVVGTALLLACGAPRLPLHAAGGMVFGFSIGFTLTILGAILGHYLVFVVVRWGGQEWVFARWPGVRRWAGTVQDQGVVSVLLARQVPAHAMLINVALALSHVTQRQFVIGTAIGLLPEAIPATLVGAGLLRASLASSAGLLAAAVATFALIWLAGGFAYRALRKGTIA